MSIYVWTIEWAAILAMTALVTVASFQVFFRYVLNDSLFWSEELMRYLMIWTTFLTSGIVYSRGGFLGMRTLLEMFPPAVQRVLDIFGRFTVIAFLAIVAWYGAEFAIRTADSRSAALEFSMFWVHVSVPVGCVLMMLHAIAEVFFRPSNTPQESLAQALQ